MSPDSLYVASVAEIVQSALRNTDDPEEIRRYLYELKDIFHEADFDGDLAEELYDNLSLELSKLSRNLNKPIDDDHQTRIIDNVHRIERFCQRRDDSESSSIQTTDTGSQEQNVTMSFGNSLNSVTMVLDESTIDELKNNSHSNSESDWEDDEQWNSDWI